MLSNYEKDLLSTLVADQNTFDAFTVGIHLHDDPNAWGIDVSEVTIAAQSRLLVTSVNACFEGGEHGTPVSQEKVGSRNTNSAFCVIV